MSTSNDDTETTSHAGKPATKRSIGCKEPPNKDNDERIFWEINGPRTAWYKTDHWIDMEDLR